MTDPYRGTVVCTVYEHGAEGDQCGMPAFGKWQGGFCCMGHTNVALIAGMYEGPLPEIPEWIKAVTPDG